MKASVTNVDLISQCKGALVRFWGDTLKIEAAREGVKIALPLLYPDGLQVVVTLKPIGERTALLTDRGEVFGNLTNSGLNVESGPVKRLVADRLKIFELQRDGFILEKQIQLPVDGLDIQLFGEALVSLAHLIYRYEPEAMGENVADRTIEKLFAERGLAPKRNAILEGSVEKRIQVDYFLEGKRGLALEVVNRKHHLVSYMEQWGWRLNDLRKKRPDLVRAMVYDPHNQDWEDTALAIGKSVCEFFCPYFETQRVHEAIFEATENED
jgi:hypothetical protein